MKKLSIAAIVIVLFSLNGCGWLARHGVNDPKMPAQKTQICPDDPMACN